MKGNKIINVGIVGTGYLGSFHIEQYKQIDTLKIAGFYEINKELSKNIEEKYHIKAYDSLKDLLNKCDAESIALAWDLLAECGLKELSLEIRKS